MREAPRRRNAAWPRDAIIQMILLKIDAPTLIIAGREDTIRKPEDAEYIQCGITNSRLESIDDAGHLMNLEQPEIFNRVLLGFIREAEPHRRIFIHTLL